MLTNEYLKRVYEGLEKRNANEPEFLQAVREVLESIQPVVEKHVSLGWGKRLRWPDDYFTLSVQLAYQRYMMKNWRTAKIYSPATAFMHRFNYCYFSSSSSSSCSAGKPTVHTR